MAAAEQTTKAENGAAGEPPKQKRQRVEGDATNKSSESGAASAKPGQETPQKPPAAPSTAPAPAEQGKKSNPSAGEEDQLPVHLSQLESSLVLPKGSVRRIVKLDKTIGVSMVSADAVFLIGKATECFLSEVA